MNDDALRDQHTAARREARQARRAFAQSPDGTFARSMRHAMQQYLDMRAAGVSREDACKGVEAVLRDAWPKRPTKYPHRCGTCDDTGWEEHICWHEQRCGRQWCEGSHPSHEHRYVTPCVCPMGDTHRKRVATVEDELARVGKTAKKRSGFSRIGG